MSFEVRQLNVADVDAYRKIRLEALKAFPEAYGTTYAEAASRPVASYEHILEQGTMFGAFVHEELCGIACFVAESGVQNRHIGHIYQMYVRNAQQGKGLGVMLLQQIFDFAKHPVRQIYLGVGTNNLAALSLYKKTGFAIYGTEPDALLVSGAYIDEHLMVKFLDTKDKNE